MDKEPTTAPPQRKIEADSFLQKKATILDDFETEAKQPVLHKLDPFQKVSAYAIQRNESVLVSAHTSASKTVVAEYAFAHCLARRWHVSKLNNTELPPQPLSNQSYREMQTEFGDVGLITGEEMSLTINPSATCLVMTTEILRSMLYRDSDIMREVAWVIFDEIHYMRDQDRGLVWEETIILLPHTVRYVFLSATIPNAMQQLSKAMGEKQERTGDDHADSHSGKGTNGKATQKGGERKVISNIPRIIKMITVENYNPDIVFSFSRREFDANAVNMSKFEFNSIDEQQLLPLLKRCIGVHHSGLLKEAIEILFQEGLVKFDGREQRNLSSGEYIQMSGRGLDHRGVVILMCDEKLEPSVAKEMIRGEADRLDSAFHISYDMIMNLMKVEGISPKLMLERCFHQLQSRAGIPKLEEEHVAEYYQHRQQIDLMMADFREVTHYVPKCLEGGFLRRTEQTLLVHLCPLNRKGIPLIISAVPCRLRIYLPNDLRPEQNQETVSKSILEVKRRFPDGIPLLDPAKEMKIKDDTFTALVQVKKIEAMVDKILKNRLHMDPRLPITGDELLTELIFNGVFNTLALEQCAALLSCFVFNEKSSPNVSIESKLPMDEEKYVASFKVELMDIVMQWCRGAFFLGYLQVFQLTGRSIFEGSIIHVFRRLEELLRQMAMAAKVIGKIEV
ncbi:hypothetical protein BT96DRAFT_956641 [Gymnopus androsaceus JB14]|uniref:Helicase ATP-binding domain-containing protein n=1 Tax=Gymnopus androsaceus JB14 TaxID=1447944 RepID=A0A6A4HUY4_9AGAR|nr:hypothetical protein BT96DRAFT_956641 [Gymnopus androsaceus JB14]